MLRRTAITRLALGFLSACSYADSATSSPDGADAGSSDTSSEDTGGGCVDCGPAAPVGSSPQECGYAFELWDGFATGGLCQPTHGPAVCRPGERELGLYDGPLADMDAPDELHDTTLCVRSTPPAMCDAGSWASPAAGACVSWPTCPDGDWPDETVLRERALGASGPIVYVAPTGSDNGDGTRERPYSRIARGLRDAADSGIVALARGRYEEYVTLGASAWVVGACVGETELVAPAADTRAIVAFTAGAGGGVATLSVSGASPGVSCAMRASCHVRDVELREVAGYGAMVEGEAAELQLERVWVREPAPQPGGLGGAGVIARYGGALVASDLLVDAVFERGLDVHEASAQLLDTALRSARTPAGSSGTSGIVVSGSGALDASGLTIEGARNVGIFVWGVGTTARLDGGAVLATGPEASTGMFGYGISVIDGAHVELRRSVVAGSAGIALYAGGRGARATLDETHLIGTLGQSMDGETGQGVQANDGAHVELEDCWIVGNRSVGVYASDEGTTVEMTGCWVTSTQSRAADDDLGGGLLAQAGAGVAVSTSRFSHNRAFGVAAEGPGTSVSLNEVAITHTRPRADGSDFGVGLIARSGARVVLGNVLLSDNVLLAMGVGGTDTSVHIDDVVAQRTVSSPLDGSFGRGISVEDGARVVGARWLLRDNRSAALMVVEPDTRVDVTDLAVVRTRAAACAATAGCNGRGTGVAVVNGGALEIERFSIVDSELIGVQVARLATLAARRGLLRNNTIGVNVQVTELELDTAFVDVRLEGNERNVASDDLPVPEPIGALPLAQ